MSCPLARVVETWRDVRAAPGRLAKRRRMAELFRHLEPEDLRLAATYLAAELPQAAIGVGWSLLSEAERAAAAGGGGPPLTLRDVDACLAAVAGFSGPGAQRARIDALAAMLSRADSGERELVAGLLLGELRQGALRALVIEALAEARGVDHGDLRRAVMNAGSLGAVVAALAQDGEAALARFGMTPLVPVEPMLAATASDLAAALVDLGGEAAAEWKLDGVRIQVHRRAGEARVYTRSLRDVTAGAAELVALALATPGDSFILDGELVSIDDAGSPVPFQDLMSRFQGDDPTAAATGTPGALQPFFFDLLYLDGAPHVDRPDRERRAALERLVGGARCIPRRIVRSGAEAQAVLDEALDHGHEGIVLKALDAPYTAGRRGGLWRKIKTAHTLDLVILAAEWGHGRRQGLLSNLHLGARDPRDPDRFWMLGKTFKGLTDAMLRQLTDDLQIIAVERTPYLVRVRPERVVEIAFDDVQRSSRYDSGLALRFARVKRFRPDKQAGDATSVDEIRALAGKRSR